MTDDAHRDDLDFALDIARQAGAVLMDHYERLEQIDYKSARDVVTEADHLSEALILDAIRERYPADAILAEETGEHRAVAGEAPTSGRGRAGRDRGERLVAGRVEDDADGRDAIDHEPDRNAEDGDSVGVVDRAVERIDDPDPAVP